MIAIQIKLNDHLYLRDPQQTKLGKRIIQYTIELIEELGFEKFTFKKLATKINSTEASVYRYFENKHKLLIYLVSWYWEWMKFQIDYNTMNMEDPERKLRIILSVLVESSRKNPAIEYVNENLLHKIVVAESTKAYHTKLVDSEDEEGFFANYKSLCNRISQVVLEYNADYPYPNSLASTLVEMANNNIYFAEHLPELTDIQVEKGNLQQVKELLEHFAFNAIRK
ncbi:MAG: TetR/AcrR family transcriptional regulator [Aureispira sp.]|nr:TetR/AcrR family transcriptional regulator [Aureispira sp.]